jgi:hypothetical protein
MDSKDKNQKYSEEQIQFLQKLVKEQRDLEQQIKVLKKACKERENRKKQVDTTIIKYFKSNDISHVNLQNSNCRIECVSVKSRNGLSQKYVTNMLQALLTDEDLARDVLDYILSGRQTTHKYKLKTIENYQQKRKIKKPEPKEDKQYSTEDKQRLVLKLKDKLNGKIDNTEISLNINNETVNEAKLTEQILENKLKSISENIKPEDIGVENETNQDFIEEFKKPMPIKKKIAELKQLRKEKKNQCNESKNKIIKQSNDIETIIETSNTNEIMKQPIDNISFENIKFDTIKLENSKPNNQNKLNNIEPLIEKPKITLETTIDNFIKQQMLGLSPNSVTNLSSLYNDLMNKTQTSIQRVNQIVN